MMLIKIILYVVSAEVGTFVCNILEKFPMNVWLSRSIGGLTAVIVALILYKLCLRKGIIHEGQAKD